MGTPIDTGAWEGDVGAKELSEGEHGVGLEVVAAGGGCVGESCFVRD